MRYAVIADVHGNLQALEAVLQDAAAQQVDQYLFVGDYCISHSQHLCWLRKNCPDWLVLLMK